MSDCYTFSNRPSFLLVSAQINDRILSSKPWVERNSNPDEVKSRQEEDFSWFWKVCYVLCFTLFWFCFVFEFWLGAGKILIGDWSTISCCGENVNKQEKTFLTFVQFRLWFPNLIKMIRTSLLRSGKNEIPLLWQYILQNYLQFYVKPIHQPWIIFENFWVKNWKRKKRVYPVEVRSRALAKVFFVNLKVVTYS